MIADRYLERRFREGYIVGFKQGYAEEFKKGYAEGLRQRYAEEFKEGYAEGWAEGRDEQCQRIRRILDHPPTELTPETRDELARALNELENAPVPDPPGYSRRRGCGCGCGRPRG